MFVGLNVFVFVAYLLVLLPRLITAEYACYHWTAEDRRQMGSRPSIRTEKAQCEKHSNTFTHGRNGAFPGCGTCWCCVEGMVVNTSSDGTASLLKMLCSFMKRSSQPVPHCSA